MGCSFMCLSLVDGSMFSIVQSLVKILLLSPIGQLQVFVVQIADSPRLIRFCFQNYIVERWISFCFYNLFVFYVEGLALMKLHKDVEMCGYEDVLVMWEILRLEMQHPPPSTRQRRQPFWRPILWSDTTTPLSNSSMFPTRNRWETREDCSIFLYIYHLKIRKLYLYVPELCG